MKKNANIEPNAASIMNKGLWSKLKN